MRYFLRELAVLVAIAVAVPFFMVIALLWFALAPSIWMLISVIEHLTKLYTKRPINPV
jgi:hypothetical protein